MTRESPQHRMLRWVAEDLNDYEAHIQADEDLPNHTPASAGYWFAGLARECANLQNAPTWLALLTPTCKRRFLKYARAAAKRAA